LVRSVATIRTISRERAHNKTSTPEHGRTAHTVCHESIEGPANLTILQIVNDTQGADDMSHHDEWIGYSHWGMFPLELKSSK
jgi:hypothetical protein